MIERCGICNCRLHRGQDTYARTTIEGRSHATKHHFLAERLFGRSDNRRGTKVTGTFDACPWNLEGKCGVYCYECHEVLLHNPVILPDDMALFADLVRWRGLCEEDKPERRDTIRGRVQLLQEALSRGIRLLHAEAELGAIATSPTPECIADSARR